MYIGIDVGGTKTLVASLDDNGVIVSSKKFPTPKDYKEFLKEVGETVRSFGEQEYIAGGVGIPAYNIDRKKEIAVAFANLPWVNSSVASDLKKIIGCPMFMENDAKLGALSEAMLVKDKFSVVLYLAIGTGIGYAIIDDLKINMDAGAAGGSIMLVNSGGKLVSWESIASGRAIFNQYGKKAKDIEDPETWQEISHNLAEGLQELISVFQPQVIIVGGGVGKYFDKFSDKLRKEIEDYHLPLVDLPELLGARRPDEAVIYGCYDYAKQQLKLS